MHLNLMGKIALVTGSTSGIGKAICDVSGRGRSPCYHQQTP
ncbi:hypothetical protein SAMN05428981_102446 [Bacillus sp. OV194]|nr:hypothetical protein SAMN05428981_102446 [Bacillus sp. OV194]